MDGSNLSPSSGDLLRVAFVAGLGRSGSTLLDRVLGHVPGCVSMGEASQIWRALGSGGRCGCGLRPQDCPFWSVVIPKVLGSWAPTRLAEARRLQRRVDRLRYLGILVVPLRPGRVDRDVTSYTTLLTTLYTTVAETAGARLVVDSGKHTSTAYLLRHLRGIDLRVIHLVRDPRGVAYSWTKVVRKSDHPDAAEMPQQYPARVARRWVLHNILLRLLAALGVPTHLLRYEDLVASPRLRVAEVGRFLGLDAEATGIPFLSDRVVDLRRVDHTLAGNPMRFRRDAVTVTLDDTWRRALPARERRLVTAITAPLLPLFGYRIRPPSSRAGSPSG